MIPANLEPKAPMKFFLELSKIPRGSGNEKASSDYVVNFAKGLGLEVVQDAEYNVIVKKPGTAGPRPLGRKENAPRVILQGHLDMVCEKNNDTVHDFLKDGIKVVYDGEFLSADGTTLGADNGVAVAMGMALLESADIPHPPLTVIMTSNEEVGLLGAMALDPIHLEGKYLINLDSGADGVFTVGCAGGMRTILSAKCEVENVPSEFASLSINVKGLLGGHSGGNIALERANANRLVGRLLAAVSDKFAINISKIEGGDKDNAIPREAEAVICFKAENKGGIIKIIEDLAVSIKDEHKTSDPGIQIVVTDAKAARCLDIASTRKIIAAINILPNGVQHYEQELPDFVETSLSLGVIRTEEDKVHIHSSIRSSVKSRKLEVFARINEAAKSLGMSVEQGADYPQWTYKKESPLRDICGEVYKASSGKEAAFHTMHGGLECGIFLEKNPALDIIAMGPNCYDVHSPDERLSAPSFARCYELLKAVLQRLC